MAILDEFLTSISGFLRAKDALQLKSWLVVEPPVDDQYYQLAQELKVSFRDGDHLERRITKLIPENDDGKADEGDVWPGFLVFMKDYLEFWRDVNFEDLLETHSQLSGLVNACITALSNSSHGIVVLPTAIQLSQALSTLAMTLDNRPDLTRRLRKVTDIDQGETRKTLVESTAESIQRAFTMCLTERSANRNGIGRDGKPEGKKIGIYSFANLALKLFFKCRKTQSANQLFTNISQHSPPLALYPASQRVTYLFYLGRFLFINDSFYRAQLCLQSAYDQCHAQCINQRRNILIYLISANMILGRFPSRPFMSRPEAAGILEKFAPISKAIRKGDIVAFKRALGPESGNEQWFFQKGVLLPLLYRCEILVWRSLARRVFLLTYTWPFDPNSRKAPTLEITDLVAAAQYCQKVLEGWQKPVDSMALMQSGRTHPNTLFMKSPDLVPPPQGPKKLGAQGGTVYGNKMPDLLEIEAIVASLVQQGLLGGFISHNQGKFAILGAKIRGGPLNAGFPGVWEVVKARAEREGKNTEVPAWVRSERKAPMGGVVNLSGIARPVGSGG
ncbi:PCI domain-containing protein [Lachnellula cervina]|uniref:PCI domain-containing protein n=1 Tax=Lachnellula cervina TaxID=1316786 RepID=A0A7D8UQ66_9HELO|nr:PCI domain-containing protein [Lachnellula cervina]